MNMLKLNESKTVEIVYRNPISVTPNNMAGIITDIFIDDNGNELSTNVLYYMRWGVGGDLDSVIWSPYNTIPLTLLSISDWCNAIREKTDYYISFKLVIAVLDGEDSYKINKIEFDNIGIDKINFKFYDLSSTVDTILSGSTKNMLNPYANMDSAVMLQTEISKGTSDSVGHEVIYFKVGGDEVNHTFKTFEKYNVTAIKKIKVVVINSDFKQKLLSYGEGSVTYQEAIELDIDRTTFELAFGQDARPEAVDYIFFPQLGRVYDITSAVPDVGFQNHVYWTKCWLKHHVSRSDVHGEQEKIEQAKQDGEVVTDFVLEAVIDFGLNENSTQTTSNDPSGNIKTELHQDTNADIEGVTASQMATYSDRSMHEDLRKFIHNDLYVIAETVPYSKAKINSLIYSYTSVPRDKIAIQYNNELSTDNDNKVSWFVQYYFNITKRRSHNQFESMGLRIRYNRTDNLTGLEYLNQSNQWNVLSNVTIDTEKWHLVELSINAVSKDIELFLFSRNFDGVDTEILHKIVHIPTDWFIYGEDSNKNYPVVFNGGSYVTCNHRVYEQTTIDDVHIAQHKATKFADYTNNLFIDNVVKV